MGQIGSRDKNGILVLGGWLQNLYLLPEGTYKVGEAICETPEKAITEYNLQNHTKLGTDYIGIYFTPWFENLRKNWISVKVPSAHGATDYTVRYNKVGEFTCDCPGYKFRRYCWHIDSVKDYVKEKEQCQ